MVYPHTLEALERGAMVKTTTQTQPTWTVRMRKIHERQPPSHLREARVTDQRRAISSTLKNSRQRCRTLPCQSSTYRRWVESMSSSQRGLAISRPWTPPQHSQPPFPDQ